MDIKTLQKFCHTWNPKLKTPFNNRGFAYGTDGFILLRTQDCTADRELNAPDFPEDSVDKSFEGPFESSLLLSNFSTVEETETCRECKGTGKITECPECEGSGEIELDSGYNFYSVECQSCEGTGHIPESEGAEDCDSCEGTGKVSVRTLVKIGSASFDNRLLNKLIENLPEDTTIAPPESNLKPALLTWSGGTGLLMPVRV